MTKVKRFDRTRGELKERPNDELFDRQPPYSLEAEMGVIGSIILLPEVCDDIATILRANDFFDEANSLLFECLMQLHDTGRRIDTTLLVDELQKKGVYERIGGASHLGRVINSVATAANAVHYARIVHSNSIKRSLIRSATEIIQDTYHPDADAKTLLNSAEQKMFSIQDERGDSTVKGIEAILHEAMDRIDARMRGEHASSGVETGFTELDAMMGGLHNSELIVLAARPSMGKTAFAMNIAEHVALVGKAPVLFISLEMSAVELADRLLCSVAEVNGHRLRNGTISKADRERLVEKAGAISESQLYVDDSPTRTVSEIAAGARRVRRRTGTLGLIVIDYLQLVEPDNARDPRQEQVAKMTRRLKGLAREMSVPVLCLAQLNRQAEVSKENRPRLSHLRESGAIEQDADVVMFVHREEYYHSGDEREQFAGQSEIIVAKQRNGPVGEVQLVWRKEFTRFANPATQAYDDFEQFNTGVEF
ncbi:MAG: replicative DNA helicase [Planctomycetota bacterium]|nr:replicative DNA helicase [Planctomycetota bacterium]MDA1179224.1 replicative DNA helicase [Planctomycetota bacterium]